MMTIRYSGCKGFTLAELSIVLVIVTLLIGGMLVPLSAQRDLQDIRETQRQLSDITEALIGYAASHAANDGRPYLPCPDTDGDGLENRDTNGNCSHNEGRLPWSDLGVGREDAWGNRFRYRVLKDFSNSANGIVLVSVLSDNSPLRVYEDAARTTPITNGLPAIIVSHGKNGTGAFNAAGGTNPVPIGKDEIANQNEDDNFVLHPPSDVPGDEFDDLVAWVSRYILFNRMIAAGRLP